MRLDPAHRRLAAVLASCVIWVWRLARRRKTACLIGLGSDYIYLILFALGAIVMRGAGCTFNDIIDRKYDAAVARTRGRPIPSGAVGVRAAAIFLALLCLAGLAILLQFNLLRHRYLGAASLLLVAAYPFMKRITWWPQAWLGLTFNWARCSASRRKPGGSTGRPSCFTAGCCSGPSATTPSMPCRTRTMTN